jgi:hypothetical protein
VSPRAVGRLAVRQLPKRLLASKDPSLLRYVERLLKTMAYVGADALIAVFLRGVFWAMGSGYPGSMRRVLNDEMDGFRDLSGEYPVVHQALQAWWRRNAPKDTGHFHLLLPYRNSPHVTVSAAAGLGDLDLLQRLYALDPYWGYWNTIGYAAAGAGYLPILEWMVLECPFVDLPAFGVEATKAGQLAAVQCLHRLNLQQNGRSLSSYCCVFAAVYGHLHVLKWLLGEGGYDYNAATLVWQAADQLEVLQWLLDEGGGQWSEMAEEKVRSGGDIRVIEWAKQRGYIVG